MKRILLLMAAVGLVVVVAMALVSLRIGHDVHAAGLAAQAEFGGDPVHALLAVVGSEGHPLRERNRAVWALGRLGDPRAFPALSACLTGRPCNHDRELCQRELEKAVTRCRGADVSAADARPGGHGKRHARGHP